MSFYYLSHDLSNLGGRGEGNLKREEVVDSHGQYWRIRVGRRGASRGEGDESRGRGRGRGRGRRGQRPKDDAGKQWVPVTKLGRLVHDGKIRTIEEIYLFSLPIKVSSIFMREIVRSESMSRI